jgi:hypothetical protein
MKKFRVNFIVKLAVLSSVLLSTSCASRYLTVAPMGQLNQVSTRNIDGSKHYVPLMTYAGVSSSEVENVIQNSKKGRIKKKNPIYSEIIKFKGNTINEAVDNVVKSQVGGEYLMNARFYIVTQTEKNGKLVVTKTSFVGAGDIWGIKDSSQNIKGFQVGDRVVFTYTKELKKILKKNFSGVKGKQYKGVIVTLMGTSCTLRTDDGVLVDLDYPNLRKLGN